MGERLIFTFPLQGVGDGGHGTQGASLGSGLLGFQPAQGRRQGTPKTIPHLLLIFEFLPPLARPLDFLKSEKE